MQMIVSGNEQARYSPKQIGLNHCLPLGTGGGKKFRNSPLRREFSKVLLEILDQDALE